MRPLYTASFMVCMLIIFACPDAQARTLGSNKLDDAESWRQLAQTVAADIRSTLLESDSFSMPAPIYIACGDSSAFDRAFTSFFVTALSNEGMQFSGSKKNALVFEWCLQPLDFNGKAPEMVITFKLLRNDLYILRRTGVYGISPEHKGSFMPRPDFVQGAENAEAVTYLVTDKP